VPKPRDMKEGNEKPEKKLRKLNRFEDAGNDGLTIALLVSIGVNLMSRGLTGRKKFVV